MEDLLIKFGKKIQELRKAQELTQEELAEKANLHNTYIGAVERGTTNLSLKSIEKLANGLGISISRIFSSLVYDEDLTQDELLISEIIRLLKGNDIITLELLKNHIKDTLKWIKDVRGKQETKTKRD
ncbi:MAG: helix-turn-helix transcriptional regulator [bacterium]